MNDSWYFDPVSGNNGNDGKTPQTPFKDFERILEMYGTYNPRIPYGQSITIGQLSSQAPGTDPIIFEPVLSGGGQLSFIGTLTPVGLSFPAGPLTPKLRVAGASPMTISGFPGVAAPMLVENQSKGSWSTIERIANGIAFLCQPFKTPGLTTIQYPIQNNVGVFVEDDSWATGDTLQLWSPPNANIKMLRARGSDAVGQGQKAVTWIQDIHVTDATGIPGTSVFLIGGEQNIVHSRCSFDPFVVGNTTPGMGIDGFSAYVAVGCAFMSGGQFRSMSLVGGTLNPLLSPGSFSSFNDGMVVDGDIIIHGPCFVKGRYSNIAFALIDQDGSLVVNHGGTLLINAQWIPGGPKLYGNLINLQTPNSAATCNDWINSTALSTMLLESAKTGTVRVGNTWVDNMPIDPTNIMAFGGIQNTGTGSKYTR
jgi:hypothetical protein